MFDFFALLTVGDPGCRLGRHGAEEHRGVLPAVEGDRLRGRGGGSCRCCEQLIDHNTRSLSLSHSFALCVSASPKAKKTTQTKAESMERVKARRGGEVKTVETKNTRKAGETAL